MTKTGKRPMLQKDKYRKDLYYKKINIEKTRITER